MSDFEATYSNRREVEVAGPEAGASVEKVRDILFGSQIKQFETRFNRLEENLRRETVELKETMRRRFESVEGFFKSETEALATRLRAERDERASACQTIDQDLKATHDAIGRQIHALDAATAEAQSGLRLELMAESRKLLDEIAERNESVRTLIEHRIAELRYQKADRALLSTLLTDLGAQLSDDSQIARAVAELATGENFSTASARSETEGASLASTQRALAAASIPPHIAAKVTSRKEPREMAEGKGRSAPRVAANRATNGQLH
ncbi:ATPase [Acidisarcina polymorpha]|uniref:ATPase n=1 Tax=Acidisarcina polymorpha TaxID=2211140 RepID=A0A2Z5FX18_9BACT|nr:hypothetical protein [Acidisarcina polymorpha]AXC11433.1 ATPase [Acidisarcina polymorpha]